MSDEFISDEFTHDVPTEVPSEVPVQPVSANPQSRYDELREEFSGEVTKRYCYKDFPTRSGRLAGKFRPIPKKVAKDGVEKDNDAILLAGALECVMRYDSAHPSANERGLVPLGAWCDKPELDPLKIDKRLTDLLGIPNGDVTATVLNLFDNNDFMLGKVAAELGNWSVDTSNEVYQDFTLV